MPGRGACPNTNLHSPETCSCPNVQNLLGIFDRGQKEFITHHQSDHKVSVLDEYPSVIRFEVTHNLQQVHTFDMSVVIRFPGLRCADVCVVSSALQDSIPADAA
mgnify:CR=1 FL=1|jgi:hypothetical protein